ncbi:PQ loop repeat-domain-containing protein [Aspergillus unguis]
MFPPQSLNINLEALSGICGSISIACWVVVFSPQIIENFRRGSAEGLSLLFLVVWLAGDVFNILGSVLQGVLPTMIILAVYYTLADIVLLGQCLYYRGFTFRDDASTSSAAEEADEIETPSPVISRKPTATERSSLLPTHETSHYHNYQSNASTRAANGDGNATSAPPLPASRRRQSASSYPHPSVDATHLSPATPFIDPSTPSRKTRAISTLQSILFNLSAVAIVCAAGILGWYVSSSGSTKNKKHTTKDEADSLNFDLLGQVFGYLCAVLYLGSRLPQILLNYRRKSTDGVSLLFFLFACIGNLTYVLSILAYSPVCKRPRHCRPGEVGELYGRYILVNLSWLVGSFGTLFLDMCIFVQFFLYQGNEGRPTMVVS